MRGIQYIVENERKHKPRGVSREMCQRSMGGLSEIRTKRFEVDGFHPVTRWRERRVDEGRMKVTRDAEKV